MPRYSLFQPFGTKFKFRIGLLALRRVATLRCVRISRVSIIRMRIAVRSFVVGCVVVASFMLVAVPQMRPAADERRPELKLLYNPRRWFELRDSVAKSAGPAFYKGAVACAFDDLRQCEKELAPVIQSSAQSSSQFGSQLDDAIEAHRLLAAAYMRHGMYREAFAQITALLALRPGDADARDDLQLLAALRGVPDQEVTGERSATVQLQDAGLPISINGARGAYWFDTGADASVMTASDAKRFGLPVLAGAIKEGDVAARQWTPEWRWQRKSRLVPSG